jgi:DNA polymerase III gamma/tau subunit
MSSGDLSVFWQEIIDSYRDIMVVKNTDKAKSYLDLTDGEYERVKKIAETFTMARLSYHTTILEGALADMQRASNSKRSVAEIALTRMCDSRLVVSTEALALRVEELEKQVSMLKMGVPVVATKAEEKPKVQQSAPKPTEAPKSAKPTATPTAPAAGPYDNWGRVLERIGEMKRSLSSRFVGAKAYRSSGNSFVIKMSPFFAANIANSAADMAIIRGVIAECEGLSPADVNVTLEGKDAAPKGAESDLEKIF